jgi:PucR family transcriptional regulator, purine catabolism regulatory protein
VHSGIAVRELASSTALARALLRAGADGLDRIVTRVQWMEVLDDFAVYLAPGDLLLTTAYNLRDDPELQGDLAARMHGCGVSALVVKCGYYLEVVPYALRRQADELGLPVFELGREIPFVELAQSISEQLTVRSYAQLRRTTAIHRELLRMVADGAGLAPVVARAAALVGAAVAVEDDRGRTIAAAGPDGEPFSPTLVAAASSTAAEVRARGRVQGRVVLAAGTAKEEAQEIVEQIATIVALEITRDEHARARDAAALTELVRDLVAEPPVGGAPLALRRASALGVDLPPAPAVLRAAIPDPAAALAAVPGEVAAAIVDGELVALLRSDRAPAWLAAAGASEAGLGRPERGPGGAARSHRQAARARVIGRVLHGPGVHRFADVEAYDLLLAALDGATGHDVRQRALEGLSRDLRATLAAYLESGGSVAETASRLFVHRNTVHYRLRRIRSVTGLDPGRLEDRVLCELALLAERLARA